MRLLHESIYKPNPEPEKLTQNRPINNTQYSLNDNVRFSFIIRST